MSEEYASVALQFGRALANRKYAEAYELTSGTFRSKATLEKLRQEFETIVPLDWGPVAPIETGLTMEDWPGKERSDVAWVYVVLGGTVYSEGLVLIISRENDKLLIREIEFGRP